MNNSFKSIVGTHQCCWNITKYMVQLYQIYILHFILKDWNHRASKHWSFNGEGSTQPISKGNCFLTLLWGSYHFSFVPLSRLGLPASAGILAQPVSLRLNHTVHRKGIFQALVFPFLFPRAENPSLLHTGHTGIPGRGTADKSLWAWD